VSQHEIISGLWQGGCRDAGGITGEWDAVVCLVHDGMCAWCPTAPPHEHCYLPMGDGPASDLPPRRQLEAAADFAAYHAKRGDRTLVHCEAGLNRSGLIVALALVRGWQMEPTAAIDLCRLRRGSYVLCNREFAGWLLDYPALSERR
jgi:hypothetical protein